MAAPSTPADKTDDHREALPVGTRFGELEIVRTLGIGGFGIVYLARDHALEREVAIKEFMPAHLAWRSLDARVSVRASSSYKTFEAGRRSFVNEARLLARFDHRSLLKVYRFWEENGTAYMAMPYLQGETLTKARKDMGRAPDEAWIRQRLLPLLDALALLHSEGVYHRDIAPDNIWLSASDGAPILLDFGAARREMGDQTQGFTAILKPSYAPIEQYAESNALRQGPWTDLYALGAVLYHLLTGEAPPPATARIVADECQPLAQRDTPELKAYSAALLTAIDWAMAVRPKERPASVAEFKAVLLGDMQAPARPRWEAPPPERLHPLMNLPKADPEATTVRNSQMPAVERPECTTMPDVHDGVVADAQPDRRLAVTVAAAEPMSTAAQQAMNQSARRKEASHAAPARAPSVAVAGATDRRRLGVVGGAVVVGLGMLVALAQVLGGREAPTTKASDAASAASGPAVVASSPALAASVKPLSPLEAASAVLAAAPPVAAPMPKPAPDPVKSAVTRRAQDSKPSPKPATVAASTPAAPKPASQPAIASPPVAASAAPPQDPTEACASRSNFLARDFCIARRCERPEFEKHPVCVQLQELREQRRERRN